jgi:hypothetical protein
VIIFVAPVAERMFEAGETTVDAAASAATYETDFETADEAGIDTFTLAVSVAVRACVIVKVADDPAAATE